MHLRNAVLGDVDVTGGVQVHGLLPALQHLLLVLHLPQLHLTEFSKTKTIPEHDLKIETSLLDRQYLPK